MKKFNLLTLTLTLALCNTTIIFSQCSIINMPNGTAVFPQQPNLYGQGFIATCSGDLEYVQFIAQGPGTASAGTLNIYSGNTVTGTPIYSQSHPVITITQANDPIRVDITGSLSLIQNNQYTFEFSVDNTTLLGEFSQTYTDGSFFMNGMETPQFDFLFSVSIKGQPNSIDDLNGKPDVQLFPNPSNKSFQVVGLTVATKYTIYNTLGTEMQHGIILPNEKTSIEQLSNGLYFLKLDNGTTMKFIKE